MPERSEEHLLPQQLADWRMGARVYAEARADTDRLIEGLETRIREAEGRIIRRLDDQERYQQRSADDGRRSSEELEKRVRELERENAALRSQNVAPAVEQLGKQVVELRTTNRTLAGVGGFLVAALGVAVAAVALFK